MKNPNRSRNELSQQGARTARSAERADVERARAPAWSPSHGFAGGAPMRRRQRRPSLNRALQELLRQHNDRHAVKPKGVSFKTQEERANALFRCFRDLHALGYRIKNPYCLGGRHIAVLVQDWTAAQPRSREHTLSPATIQAELSHLRTFACWIGKAGLVRDAEAYVSDPRLVTRRYVATKDKAWSAQAIDPDALIRSVEAHDVWVGAQLRVAQAFGLRVKEAVMLRPHEAEKPGEVGAAGLVESGPCLEVYRGTKGGRLRHVPIDTLAKRLALETAKKLVSRESDFLANPSRSLKQNLDRLHNVMKRFGITRRALGITPHGLRHGYAADRYAAVSGVPAPVRGGPPADRDTDHRSRLRVAEELGHGRPQILGAYIGARRAVAGPDRNVPSYADTTPAPAPERDAPVPIAAHGSAIALPLRSRLQKPPLGK
jgi:integrase